MRFQDARPHVGEQNDHLGVLAPGLYRQNAAGFFHGIRGVAEDVEENLKELGGVTADPRQDGLELSFNANMIVVQIQGMELQGIRHDGVDIQEHALRRNLPGKAEQAGNELLGAPRLVADLAGQRFRRLARGRIFGEQVRIAEYGREGVVDFVSRPGGELPERYQLLRLHQLCLEPL